MKKYKNYILREANGVQYPFKPRPYDNADYYYAKSYDGSLWIIGYKGKKYSEFKGSFEDVVDYLENLNTYIKPKMCYN